MKIIYWKSRITEASGNMEIELPDVEAEMLVRKFNNENPDIYHWTEDVKEE